MVKPSPALMSVLQSLAFYVKIHEHRHDNFSMFLKKDFNREGIGCDVEQDN